jgi:hypothetical protein
MAVRGSGNLPLLSSSTVRSIMKPCCQQLIHGQVCTIAMKRSFGWGINASRSWKGSIATAIGALTLCRKLSFGILPAEADLISISASSAFGVHIASTTVVIGSFCQRCTASRRCSVRMRGGLRELAAYENGVRQMFALPNVRKRVGFSSVERRGG